MKKGPVVLALLLVAVLVACGDETATQTGQTGPSLTAPAPAMHDYVGQLTSNDGYRYRVTLSVAAQAAVAGPDACPPSTAAAGGLGTFPVALTVRNESADKPAPFPPVRIELSAQGAPQPVLVRDVAGPCTATPRVPSLGPAESVTFRGTTPAIATSAAPGSGGRIEVSASETRFTLAAPVP